MMQQVKIALGARSYVVQVGVGLDISGAVANIGTDFVLIYDAVFDELEAGRYRDHVEAALAQVGKVVAFAVPSGEGSKCLDRYSALAEKILQQRITRETVIVALGGGVIGDLAGFLAASLLRGLRFVQIPTTLLAQVDSSVGGKVGINAEVGKNLIGAFHQPHIVLADLNFLHTLPKREFAAGMAEVIKAGLLADSNFWQWLQEHAQPVQSRDAGALAQMIARAVAIKADIVASDELEKSGRRALLNFGHTFGHALEAAAQYDAQKLVHGEAVSLGMVMAARLSVQMGMLDDHDLNAIVEVLNMYSLPAQVSNNMLNNSSEGLCRLMYFDKKNTRQGLKLVLLRDIGDAVVMPAPEDKQIMSAIAPSLGA